MMNNVCLINLLQSYNLQQQWQGKWFEYKTIQIVVTASHKSNTFYLQWKCIQSDWWRGQGFALGSSVSKYLQADYMNSLHTNIQFTKEEESPDGSSFPFLDMHVTRWYQIPYQHVLDSHRSVHKLIHSPRKYKINLIKCLLSQASDLFTQDFVWKRW